MLKYIQIVCILLLCFFCVPSSYSQIEVIEIDTLTKSAVRTAPYDKPFLIKAQIEAESVDNVFIIKKVGNKSFYGTLNYYAKDGSFIVPRLERNYFWTKKTGDKNNLFISIADGNLFKPSENYFIIPSLKKTDPSVIAFFDFYHKSTLPGSATISEDLKSARENLSKFQKQMENLYSKKIEFGFMTLGDFWDTATSTVKVQFKQDFDAALLLTYNLYHTSKSNFATALTGRVASLNTNLPSFDPLTYNQLFFDTTINKEAIQYLSGNIYTKNDRISDFSTVQQNNLTKDILSGIIPLTCIYCKAEDMDNNSIKELSKRMANLDSSIETLGSLKRSLYLLKPTSRATSDINSSLPRIDTWIAQLKQSKEAIEAMAKQRKKIENLILDNVFANKKFIYTEILGGNTYMNFETRNKVLLTPDFGVVIPFGGASSPLEYKIMPYLGFNINLMAVDKDIPFKSYIKHPLQYFSLMVGWSLVNVNREEEHASFFEKSSLLTGIGFRFNNVIRLTAGGQWIFKLGNDNNNNPTRKLQAIPFVGLSFDLNIKQYLNGFGDILSGISKSNPAPTKTAE